MAKGLGLIPEDRSTKHQMFYLHENEALKQKNILKIKEALDIESRPSAEVSLAASSNNSYYKK